MRIELPWPPSMNTYWRNVKGKVLISKKGRAYRKLIADMALVGRWHSFGADRISITIQAHPPDKRRRDLDNLPKAIFDSLEKAGVFIDDEQIDYFSVGRCEIEKPGKVVLIILPVGELK